MNETKLFAAVLEVEEQLKGASPKKCAKLVRRVFALKKQLVKDC